MKSALLAFLTLAALGLTACSRPAGRNAASTLPAVTVTTALVEAATLPRVQLVAGTVRPVDRAVIAARIMGSVTRVPTALGARVAAGDLLVELSAAEIGARLDQARANLDQVDRELARETTTGRHTQPPGCRCGGRLPACIRATDQARRTVVREQVKGVRTVLAPRPRHLAHSAARPTAAAMTS